MVSAVAQPSWMQWIRRQRSVLLVWGILLLLIVFASLASDRFLTPFNLTRLAAQMTMLALVAIGQTFVLLTAGIDLSVGSVVSLIGTVMVAVVNHLPNAGIVADSSTLLALGVIISLLIGALIGLINGLAVTRLRVSPFMATLAMLSIVQGMALVLSVNFSGTLPRDFAATFTGDLGPVPIPLLIVFIATVIAALVLRHTRFGRHVYAVGSNESATRLSGMQTDRIKTLAYVISGLLASCAGVYISARTLSGDPFVGESVAFESITAAVLGTVSLFGGRGSILGTIAGVLIIAILGNMLNLLRVPSDYQYILRGVLLVLAVMLYSRRTN